MIRKNASLEALRGLAALAVLATHLLLAFAPSLPRQGAWWFGAVNGQAAVVVFFVLSGFVLTSRALATGDGLPLAQGALKRWPRLAAPICAVVLFSWALFELGAYAYVEAGALSGSHFLATFADAQQDGPLPPSLWQAVLQGSVLALFRGWGQDRTYDIVLWTMHIEFLGSFIAFGLGLALIQLRAAPLAARLALVVMTALLVRFVETSYLTFVAGVGLALILVERPLRLSKPAALAIGVVAFWLLGYLETSPDHAWLALLGGAKLPRNYAYVAAAMMLIVALQALPMPGGLVGRCAMTLGRLSFPVYLLHVPVLCSVGARVFLLLHGGAVAAMAAMVVTVLVTLLLAQPLAAFDGWWTRQLDRLATRLLSPAPTQIRNAFDAVASVPTAPISHQAASASS